MENNRNFSVGRYAALSALGALLCGMLWRMRGSHGWGSESGLFNVAFVMLLFLVLITGGNKKTTPLKIAFTSASFILTVPQWGTLNHQITGAILNNDDPPVEGVPVYSAVMIMLMLGYTIMGVFGILLGNMFSEKNWKIKNFILLLAVFFGVQYLCKATVAHPILHLIQPVSGEAFSQSLSGQGITDSLLRVYLSHFDDVSWAKKIVGGRNYFAEIELISRFIAVIVCQIVTRFAFKDKTAAKISAVSSAGFAFAITVSDLFFLVGSDGFIADWSCWEYFTGFFAGACMTIAVLLLGARHVEAENNFAFIPERPRQIAVYILGICAPVAFNILRPVILRFDGSSLQIPVAVIVSLITVGLLLYAGIKNRFGFTDADTVKFASLAFFAVIVCQVFIYFICGAEYEEITNIRTLHNICVLVSAVPVILFACGRIGSTGHKNACGIAKKIKEKFPDTKSTKEVLSYIFIDGLSGMALGLFATLITGTILDQISSFIPGVIGTYLHFASMVAKSVTGAGIGAGMAFKYKSSPLTGVSAAAAGMTGAFASKLIAGAVIDGSALTYSGPGDPLGAFIAAFFAIQTGRLISGKTKLDILLTPACSIIAGSAAGLLIGPSASKLSALMGELVNWGTECHPFLMGIIVSVVMGIALTLPISSAAIGVILGLSGIAGGAAVTGCCAQMIGFGAASWRENKCSGFLAQGVGTSMLQMPNILKHPLIWIPPILTSAILGPVSTVVLRMQCGSTGAGMGTSGLVGQFSTYAAMTENGTEPKTVLLEIAVMHFIAPALISLGISECMRKCKLIRFGDMALSDIVTGR